MLAVTFLKVATGFSVCAQFYFEMNTFVLHMQYAGAHFQFLADK